MSSAFTYMYLQKWTANVFYDMNRIMRKRVFFDICKKTEAQINSSHVFDLVRNYKFSHYMAYI